MNRKLLTYFEGVVVIRAKGKRIERFLSYIYKLKINLLDIKYIDRQNVLIKIFNRDFDKVKGIKTTFEINVVGYEGKLRLKEGIKEHLLLLLSIIIGYLFLLFLSNVIFDVEVVHSNASVRKLIAVELAERNIKRWHFKKSFNELQQTKEQILNEYKDRLEWLEIETVGTKYIVKVEERKIKKIVDDYEYQDIVSTKNAIILRIDAIEGEIVKRKNDYVKKGDIIISGRIMKGQEVSKIVKANGKIYGEVWYNIKVEHPLIYQSKVQTGKKKDVYKVVFLNRVFALFNTRPFASKISKYYDVVANPLVPFSIIKDKQREVVIVDEIYTDGEALIMAEAQAIKKMEEYLDEDEYVISQRKLKYHIADQKLYLEMFFKVYENIGTPRRIVE